MKFSPLLAVIFLCLQSGCDGRAPTTDAVGPAQRPITTVKAMRDVMHHGELAAAIRLDTLGERAGLYGLGPLAGLRGELLVEDGRAFVSRVIDDSTMSVEETFAVGAPFFVYGRVSDWDRLPLPPAVRTLRQLETFIDARRENTATPLIIRFTGRVESALVHVQNLPEGAVVRSPAEAHAGQVDYPLGPGEVRITGFFSRHHRGVFTHHDSFLHAHLITADERVMGHLDAVELVAGELWIGG